MTELLETCEAAARAGGRELLAWRGRFQTRQKAPADLVTDADMASQSAVRSEILARYPDDSFVGEEQLLFEPIIAEDRSVWIADPLDGTTNYVHGYPFYSVSVAVARGNKLLAGVVYDPLTDECFAAERGCGASCNGERLTTSRIASVGEALVAVSLPPRVAADAPDLMDFVRVAQVSQAVRRSGSAALNLAYVASGRLDAFWATTINPWDVAAGILLIQEAGGVVTGRDGGAFDLWNPHFIAAAGDDLHRQLRGVLGNYRA
jgi:myo-inositol-1(or 4)-monophosphatase